MITTCTLASFPVLSPLLAELLTVILHFAVLRHVPSLVLRRASGRTPFPRAPIKTLVRGHKDSIVPGSCHVRLRQDI